MQYTLGETVVAISDNAKGKVIDVNNNTFVVRWSDGDGVIEYPTETELLRKLWPWEQNS